MISVHGSVDVHDLSRHILPDKKRVDDAFPVRVKIKIPPNGLGNLISEILVWLRTNIGADRFSNRSITGVWCRATAYYFRDMNDAQVSREMQQQNPISRCEKELKLCQKLTKYRGVCMPEPNRFMVDICATPNSSFSSFLSENGHRMHIFTAKRMISGLVLR
ncbi:hypothetical protein [Sulfitobacter sp. MF3-043]|uniref:hypothetical protein n=1 Tax=Sulfitobacter sediminivivens TaxID=3252902 RepID=UPI0036DE62AF